MFKDFFRKILLKLLELTERKPRALRFGKNILLSKEIHIPPAVIVCVNMIFLFVALLIEFGPLLNNIVGLVLFVCAGFIVFIYLLRSGSSRLMQDNDAMMLLGLLVVFSVIGIEAVKSFKTLSPYLMPVSGIVLLTALLLNRNIALIVAVTVSLISTILNSFRFEYMFFHLFSSMGAIFVYSKIKHRQDIVYGSANIIAMNILAVVILTMLSHLSVLELKNNIFLSVMNGLSCAVLVLILLSPLETFFSRITDIKLLELADFNQPLLRQLMLEAPGTYHHSLTVASIAESCADAIGANSLLCRVGAYYHDIGKLVKPEYFIENQIALDNPHDNIPPTMSGLVVISHVKEGVGFAMKKNLDKPIIDLIEQHHGTSLIISIYQKALEKNDLPSDIDYRYSGPKPKTKEAAILMLADSCEAASRSLPDPTPNRLKDMIEKIINNKFTDGQFDDAPITLSDLNKIAQRMTETLSGIFHARIEYENSEKKQNGTQ